MFTYLRYFYAVSLLLIALAAMGIGVIVNSMITRDMSTLVRQQHIALAHSFKSTVWSKYTAHADALDTLKDNQDFIAESKKLTADIDILRIAVYTPEGKLIFSSNPNVIYDRTLQPINANWHKQLAQDSLTNLHENAKLTDPIEDTRLVTVLQSVIHDSDVGIIELISDISKPWHNLGTIKWVATCAIVLIFLVLIAALVLITKRAEAILAKQHEVNLELTAAAATAEAENRDKSQFLANISHELRTPLNAIIGFSEIIRKESLEGLSPTHREYIQDIYHSGVHLLSLINDILDYSKAEAGKLEVEMSEIDVTKLVSNSMRLVIPRSEAAQVSLIKELPAGHIVGVTDAKKLKQVLLNLLSNAVKFTPPGGEVKVIAWEEKGEQRIIHIQVKDTGIGIAAKDLQKVMTPFGQVDSKLSRKYEGTGLGLPLSKKFVEIMGGTFSLESEVNVGTTVTISLPQAQA